MMIICRKAECESKIFARNSGALLPAPLLRLARGGGSSATCIGIVGVYEKLLRHMKFEVICLIRRDDLSEMSITFHSVGCGGASYRIRHIFRLVIRTDGGAGDEGGMGRDRCVQTQYYLNVKWIGFCASFRWANCSPLATDQALRRKRMASHQANKGKRLISFKISAWMELRVECALEPSRQPAPLPVCSASHAVREFSETDFRFYSTRKRILPKFKYKFRRRFRIVSFFCLDFIKSFLCVWKGRSDAECQREIFNELIKN